MVFGCAPEANQPRGCEMRPGPRAGAKNKRALGGPSGPGRGSRRRGQKQKRPGDWVTKPKQNPDSLKARILVSWQVQPNHQPNHAFHHYPSASKARPYNPINKIWQVESTGTVAGGGAQGPKPTTNNAKPKLSQSTKPWQSQANQTMIFNRVRLSTPRYSGVHPATKSRHFSKVAS